MNCPSVKVATNLAELVMRSERHGNEGMLQWGTRDGRDSGDVYHATYARASALHRAIPSKRVILPRKGSFIPPLDITHWTESD